MTVKNVTAFEFDDSKIEVSLDWIGPTEAEAMLGRNLRNRSLRRHRVEMLAHAIARGEWCLNGETLVEDADGKLVDGQHRLAAVIESGERVPFLVVRGVEPIRAQDTQGSGQKRTLADQLKLRGEINCAALASAIRLLYQLRVAGQVVVGTQWLVTTPQGLALLDEHPGIRDLVSTSGGLKDPPLRYPQGLAAALRYLFNEVDQEDAEFFWARLADGTGLADGNPVLTLRDRMIADASRAGGRTGMVLRYRAAITIKAWNAWRRGDGLHVLKWRPGGSSAEDFPRWDTAE